MVNAFTVDLEDWFQAITSLNAIPERWPEFEDRVELNTQRLLLLLDEFGIKATFFTLGRVAEEYPDLIRQIDQCGHEIGVHGFWHSMLQQITPDQFSAELDRALAVLAPLVSQPILGHRAPYFSINQETLWALEILVEKGFAYDSSFFSTRNVLYGFPGSPRFPHKIPGIDLIEFPLSTAQWANILFPIAGGFYFRLFPYFVTSQGIQQLNRDGQAAIMYIHPWEIDNLHRFNRIRTREWIVQYTGRGGLEKKLRRLFTDFQFVPIRNLLFDYKERISRVEFEG